MKPTKFSHHIGNIDDRIIQQAENMPNYGHRHRNHSIRRILSVAAVVALMAASFAAGVFVLAKEPETIYIEVGEIVFVEKAQEIIIFDESGISLILPDWWEGKYEYEIYDSGVNQDGVYIHLMVYHSATRERLDYDAGLLFGISFTGEFRPLDYIWPQPGFTVAITEHGTYVLLYPSDVQFDMDDPISSAEYMALSEDVRNIEIVMSAELLSNTINMSTWVRGVVFVSFFEDWAEVGSAVLEADQSRTLKNIIASLDYSIGYASFNADFRFMFDGDEYLFSSSTGTIMNTLGEPRHATIPAEDLSVLLALFDN